MDTNADGRITEEDVKEVMPLKQCNADFLLYIYIYVCVCALFLFIHFLWVERGDLKQWKFKFHLLNIPLFFFINPVAYLRYKICTKFNLLIHIWLLQVIALSACANKLSKIQDQAEEYAALIMEELDPDNLGYIEVFNLTS